MDRSWRFFTSSVALVPGVLPDGIAHVFPVHFHLAGGDTRRRTPRALISWPRSRVWAFAPGLRASLDPAPGPSLPALSLAPGFGASFRSRLWASAPGFMGLAPGFGLPLPAFWVSLPAFGARSRLCALAPGFVGLAPGFLAFAPGFWGSLPGLGFRSRLFGLAPGFVGLAPGFWALS